MCFQHPHLQLKTTGKGPDPRGKGQFPRLFLHGRGLCPQLSLAQPEHAGADIQRAAARFQQGVQAPGEGGLFLARLCAQQPAQRGLAHGRRRGAQKGRVVNAVFPAAPAQQRGGLSVQVIRHLPHIAGKARQRRAGAGVQAFQRRQHLVARAVAGIGVARVGLVLHMGHAFGGKVSEHLRPRHLQQGAHVGPAHGRDARRAPRRRAPRQAQQHGLGLVVRRVGRGHFGLFRRGQPVKKGIALPPGPILARAGGRRQTPHKQRHAPRGALGAHERLVRVRPRAPQAVVHMGGQQPQGEAEALQKQKME